MKKLLFLFALLISQSAVSQIVSPSGLNSQGVFMHGTINGAASADSLRFFTASGAVSQKMKFWLGTVAPTIANGFSVDISAAAFSTITCVQLTAAKSANSVISLPIAVEDHYTNTAVFINIVAENTGLVAILAGLLFTTNLTGVTVNVLVIGY